MIGKVCVVGNTASGKTHLANRVGAALELPVFHLDRLYWRPDWSHAGPEEFRAAQRDLIAGDRWVIDGCFAEFGLAERFAAADAVVFLDLPAFSCIRRAAGRRGTGRDDLPPGANDARMGLGLTMAFLAEMALFPILDRRRILRAAKSSTARMFRLRTWAESTHLVATLGDENRRSR